jgi:hypothetical protein
MFRGWRGKILGGACANPNRNLPLTGNSKTAPQALEASLRSFSVASQQCCKQGPLETLFNGDQLLHQLVDSCLASRLALVQLLHVGQLPTVARAQASMLSAQLNSCTMSFETLRRLHSVRFKLQEEVRSSLRNPTPASRHPLRFGLPPSPLPTPRL